MAQLKEEKPKKELDTDTDTDSDEDKPLKVPPNVKDVSKCWRCQIKGIEYACMPCNCAIYCKKCAMKMATGGKCKRCGSMFVSLRRIK